MQKNDSQKSSHSKDSSVKTYSYKWKQVNNCPSQNSSHNASLEAIAKITSHKYSPAKLVEQPQAKEIRLKKQAFLKTFLPDYQKAEQKRPLFKSPLNHRELNFREIKNKLLVENAKQKTNKQIGEEHIKLRKRKIERKITNFSDLHQQFVSFKQQILQELKKQEKLMLFAIREIEQKVKRKINEMFQLCSNCNKKMTDLPDTYLQFPFQKLINPDTSILSHESISEISMRNSFRQSDKDTSFYSHKNMFANSPVDQNKLKSMSPDSKQKFCSLFSALSKVKNEMNDLTSLSKEKQMKGKNTNFNFEVETEITKEKIGQAHNSERRFKNHQ